MACRNFMFSFVLLTQCASGRIHRELIDDGGKGVKQSQDFELPGQAGQNFIPNLDFLYDGKQNKLEEPGKTTPSDPSHVQEGAPPDEAKQNDIPRMDYLYDGKQIKAEEPKKKTPEGVDSKGEHEHPMHKNKKQDKKRDGDAKQKGHDKGMHGKEKDMEKRHEEERHSKERQNGEGQLKDDTNHEGKHHHHHAGPAPELGHPPHRQGLLPGKKQELVNLIERGDKPPHERLEGVMKWLRKQRPEDVDAIWPDFKKSLLHAIFKNKNTTRPLLRGEKKPLDGDDDIPEESDAPSNTTAIIGGLCGGCLMLSVYVLYSSKNRSDAARAPLMSNLDGYDNSLERQLR
eukprot:GEMP01047053.1.p1 GENE.GEMP01047053.1~~GEMP01047053.1.p1  ORF type:complete len:344 (+),score=86.27 GEMP01047053.1:180-1211(+)